MKAKRNLAFTWLLILLNALVVRAQNDMQSVIKQKINAYFQQRFHVQANDLRVNFVRLPDFSHLKTAGYQVECASQTNVMRLGHQTIWLRLLKNQKVVLKTPVTVEVAVRKAVVVTTQTIGFRKTIEPQTVQLQYLWLTDTEIFNKAVQDVAKVVGMETTHFIPKGTIIQIDDVREPSVVKPGDEVVIQVQAGELLVTTRGIARSAGAIGDVVSVKNLMTGKNLKGRVTSPGVVCINR